MADLSESSPDRRGAVTKRRAAISLLLLLLSVPVIRGCAIQGLVRPVRVAGGSMAGQLYGPHLLVRCLDCGFEFRCGEQYVPTSRMVVCPNCGCADNQAASKVRHSGRRVLIDRWAKWVHGPQQWQPTAFALENETGTVAVKRLVAQGPGELEIRDGNVFVDNVIQQKSLQEFRQIRILVHDDRYRPLRTSRLPDRWRGSQPDSHWVKTEAGYTCQPKPQATAGEIDWLQYVQWTCWPHPSPPAARTDPAPVFDHYAYNQSLSRSSLHRVTDLLIQFQVTLEGAGSLWLRANDGSDRLRLQLQYPAGVCRVWRDSDVIWQAKKRLQKQPSTIEFAICDQQVLAAINGDSLCEISFQPNSELEAASPTPLAIGAERLLVQLESIQIYRDTHYQGPAGEDRWIAPQRLGPQQWFALGDNVPASIDSRRGGAIEESAILGPVVLFGD